MNSPPTVGSVQNPKNYRPDGTRKNSGDRGYGWRWQQYVAAYKRQHPLCADCLAAGRVTPMRDVHHIEKATTHPELFWEPDNHRGLCGTCHKVRTARGE